jgi:hypothetical protein
MPLISVVWCDFDRAPARVEHGRTAAIRKNRIGVRPCLDLVRRTSRWVRFICCPDSSRLTSTALLPHRLRYATSNVRRRRAARVEPLRCDPQLPVDAGIAHVADRRGHRLHGVRSRLRPPRPRLRLRLLAAAVAAHARRGGRGLPSGLLRREGRGRGVPCGVRGAGCGSA